MLNSDPQQRWPKLPCLIHKPWQAHPDAQSSSPSLQPTALRPQQGPRADAHPGQSLCGQGRAGQHMHLSQKQKHHALTLKLQ